MKDLIKLLVNLQDTDSRILQKRTFIEKVPLRITEVDEPLKDAQLELEKMKQRTDGLAKKKRETEKMLEEIHEKVKKMKARVSEIKTNKEYQAHLKEIESTEKDIGKFEEQILLIMEEMDHAIKQQKEKESIVKVETDKLNVFKKGLDQEVEKFEKELASLKEERRALVARIDGDVYNLYMALISTCNGIAVTLTQNEVCLGCNMNIPPQLFVEIKKNDAITQCPQCRRILYFSGEELLQ